MPKKIKTDSKIEKENNKSHDVEKFFSAPEKKKISVRRRGNDFAGQFKIVSKEFGHRKMYAAIIGAVFVFLIAMCGYFYYQYKKAISPNASSEEISAYVSKIDKFMVLPEGETPTMAKVADAGKLSTQSFFANAQNGDVVLFYNKAQKAVLYRPNINKIIEATSMNGNIPAGSQSASAQSVQTQAAAPVQQPQTADAQQISQANDASKQADTAAQVTQ
jgi:hypothetical protein